MIQIGKDIQLAATYLQKGELVAIPTETVYGLAANALDEIAVKKIFAAKNRPLHNPLILHVASIGEAEKYVLSIPAILKELMQHYSPGPITFLLPKNDKVNDVITNGSANVAIRIPHHSLTLELLKSITFPLVAPSANKFGSISPTQVEHVQQQFTNEVAYILDGGNSTTGIESTIVGYENNTIVIYRHGAITLEMIQQHYPFVESHTHNNVNPQAPGMLTQHYSPNTPMRLFASEVEMLGSRTEGSIGYLCYTAPKSRKENCFYIVLSETGTAIDAAKNLYAALYEMDKQNLDYIYAALLPEQGIGIAINDKLRRASAAFT